MVISACPPWLRIVSGSDKDMQSLQNKQILVGICGGIAAYKVPDLVRKLRAAGAQVRVVMTRAACEFITPLTLQAVSGQRVHLEMLDPEAEAAMGHIELARWADAIVVAPATAETIARIAQGRADDLLTTVIRAADVPVLLAPAMNQAMWRDAATQRNCAELVEAGCHFVGPASGEQACGDTGSGRMSEPLDIAAAVDALFEPGLLAGQRVVLTAGPTREPLDPVRYLSNYSSGKMGFALAQAAAEAGAQVTLIAGPVAQSLATESVRRVDVVTAKEMLTAARAHCADADILIAAAAVADYRPREVAPQKLKKSVDDSDWELVLEKTPDILATIAAENPQLYCVGFAAETENMLDHARQKLAKKAIQMIVANDVSRSDIGFGADDNEVTVITAREQQSLPCESKAKLARKIIKLIAEHALPEG